MTLDREIRFTPDEIVATQTAVKKRKRELGRSIAAAEANRRAGATIQWRTHERNVEELAALDRVAENLEVARKQIARRVAERVGVTS